jgi:uncharacterized RDD family membrane protein YckC
MPRVGFWRRSLALLLDLLFLEILLVVAQAAMSYLGFDRRLRTRDALIVSILQYGLTLAYFSFEFGAAASVGKMLIGLEIANIDATEPSTAALVNRWTTKWSFLLLGLIAAFVNNALLAWLANLMWLIVVIGCFAALGESRLTWHDRWSKTAVFRARELRQPPGFEPVMTASPAGPHSTF